jgi:deazaflavin-dependent oxidoreductase (nitroreductase family)
MSIARGFMRAMVWLYRRSGGRIGGSMRGAPVLLVTTTGRRSGQPWTNPLIYQPDGDGWVIIASNAGNAKHPGWWLNLRKNPQATIEIGRDSYPVTARETEGDERERLWQKMVGVYQGYEGYQKKTTRRLPVVHLDRR